MTDKATEGANNWEDGEQFAKGKAKGQKPKGSLLYTLGMLVCGAVFVVCAGLLIQRFWSDHQAENEFAALEAQIEEAPTTVAGTPAATEPSNTEKFNRLLAQNPDFIGWLSIADTNLSFPVMHKPANRDYYLRHDFAGEYSVYGVPYLDGACTLNAEGQSDNLTIYGHNMKTGTIFGCLTGYKKADYYTQHPIITFDTLYGDADYEVFAAFAVDVVADTSFAYNSYVDMDEKTFDEFVGQALTRSDVNTGITPTYGDKLITLSTCEYSTANGRYVVCARKVAAEPVAP
ncbi:MAG: class B sortase [Gemmiger sp.]|nr:class B sortase [Gemmiger sp.]